MKTINHKKHYIEKERESRFKESEKSRTEKIVRCTRCHGHGWWLIGDLVPLGFLDSREQTGIKCPWCLQGKITNSPRYKHLLKYKGLEDKKIIKK